MKTTAVLLSLLLSGWVWAAGNSTCDEFYGRFNAHNIYRQNFDPLCMLSVNPTDTVSMIYRSFSFTNFGSLMVFNSFSPEDNTMATGARVYYFFPRQVMPDIKSFTADSVTVQTATPDVWLTFSRSTGQVTEFSAGSFVEQPVSPANKGGLQLTINKGLMLDVGYARGQDPSSIKTNNSVFIDGAGHRCAVANTQIFNYLPSDDIEFRMNDAQLDLFLKKNCPQLAYSF